MNFKQVIHKGICSECKGKHALDQVRLVYHTNSENVLCNGSGMYPIKELPRSNKKNLLGHCTGCKKLVILVDGKTRVHKDNTNSECSGSEQPPITDEWLKIQESEQIKKLESAIQELLQIAALPVGLESMLQLSRLYRRIPEIAATHEYIKIMIGEHGQYLLHDMSEADSKEFDRILKEETK